LAQAILARATILERPVDAGPAGAPAHPLLHLQATHRAAGCAFRFAVPVGAVAEEAVQERVPGAISSTTAFAIRLAGLPRAGAC